MFVSTPHVNVCKHPDSSPDPYPDPGSLLHMVGTFSQHLVGQFSDFILI